MKAQTRNPYATAHNMVNTVQYKIQTRDWVAGTEWTDVERYAPSPRYLANARVEQLWATVSDVDGRTEYQIVPA
jgi:hypothetical protein